MEHNWAVYTRLVSPEVEAKLNTYIAYLVEDDIALRGFVMVEPQPPDAGLIVTLAVHDNSSVVTVLDLVVPALDAALRMHHLSFLLQIGQAPWLTSVLPQYGFAVADQIVTFEWQKQPLPPLQQHPHLQVRPAHLYDLPDLLVLDQLVFGPTWRKPRSTFKQALALATSFNVGIVEDTLIAYEWCDQFGDHGHLTRLATHPTYQQQGIGAQMLRQALETLMGHGVVKVTLNTQIDNVISQKLYRRFGFKPTAQVIDVMLKQVKK